MITLTRINGEPLTVNAEEIETVETFHDSTLTLRSGRKVVVRENADEIIHKVIEYKRQTLDIPLRFRASNE
ncbi:MAG: flagellar FlbD family protein [Bacteroidetes bacterium]|nr:flagellar FlbD family protein [Bacteroidota bacterium]MCZ2132023.1 flagellar FlbD family protein [Bacteroidota bacterium]